MAVNYEWDEGKDEANVAQGRPAFTAMEDFEWDSAIIERSDRYGELRWAATVYIGQRLYRVVYTERGGFIRIISLRLASRREVRQYAGA